MLSYRLPLWQGGVMTRTASPLFDRAIWALMRRRGFSFLDPVNYVNFIRKAGLEMNEARANV